MGVRESLKVYAQKEKLQDVERQTRWAGLGVLEVSSNNHPPQAPPREGLNLGSQKCHFLHFSQDILSK